VNHASQRKGKQRELLPARDRFRDTGDGSKEVGDCVLMATDIVSYHLLSVTFSIISMLAQIFLVGISVAEVSCAVASHRARVSV
jgi:hypothetical protein